MNSGFFPETGIPVSSTLPQASQDSLLAAYVDAKAGTHGVANPYTLPSWEKAPLQPAGGEVTSFVQVEQAEAETAHTNN